MAETNQKRGWRYFRSLAIATIVGLSIGAYFGFSLFEAYRRMHPGRVPIGSVSPADLALDYTDVTLTTRDGVRLQGWYVPSTNGAAVILVHAFNGNRTGTIYHAALLAEHGYGVLMYDTRSQGESEGGLYAWGWDAHWDVIAALDYLQHRPEVATDRIGVLGLSAGAAIAMRAAAETDGLAAVVAEGSGWPTIEDWFATAEPEDAVWVPGTWVMYKYVEAVTGIRNPIPIVQAVSNIAPAPLFLIAAGEDRAFAQACFDAAIEPKTYWNRDEPGHTDALFAHPDEYEQRVVGFFDRALLQDG
jgi:pimeloyl-ACP methyl ester carboxylesterase